MEWAQIIWGNSSHDLYKSSPIDNLWTQVSDFDDIISDHLLTVQTLICDSTYQDLAFIIMS